MVAESSGVRRPPSAVRRRPALAGPGALVVSVIVLPIFPSSRLPVSVSVSRQVGQRRPQVVVVGVEAGQRAGPGGAGQIRLQGVRQRGEDRRVRRPGRRRFARLRQQFQGVFPDRLQGPDPLLLLIVSASRRQQVVIEERVDGVEKASRRDVETSIYSAAARLLGLLGSSTTRLLDRPAHALQGAHRRAAREDAEAAEEGLLRRGEEVVAPGHGGVEGAVAGGAAVVAGPGGQQVEAAAEPGQERGGRQQADPGGGQFDRERQAVQPGADLRHGGRVPGRERKPRPRRRRPRHEEAHRRVLA